MLPKVHIECPYKYYNLYEGTDLIYISEASNKSDFIQLVKATFEDIDLDDPKYRIETRETETVENEGWE